MIMATNSYSSHREFLIDLLGAFVPEPWVGALDFSTLEKVNNSYVTDDLRSREDDIVWRVRFGARWLYVYILLEFQSSIDRYMAVRMLSYVGLSYQDLIRQFYFAMLCSRDAMRGALQRNMAK
jgi:predicted transposase YdaD